MRSRVSSSRLPWGSGRRYRAESLMRRERWDSRLLGKAQRARRVVRGSFRNPDAFPRRSLACGDKTEPSAGMGARRATTLPRSTRGNEPVLTPADGARRAPAFDHHELLTAQETADLLRTTRAAVYAMVERGTMPGVVRFGRRVLFNAAVLRRHLGLVR